MRLFAFVCAVVIAAGAIVSGAGPLEARPASVSSVRAELERAGERLDRVTEAYDQAKLRRARLDSKLAGARSDLARTESSLKGVRRKLGVAVRDLYMHPAGGLAAFFQARTFGQLQRGNSLAAHATLSTDDLILQIRKARAAERASAQRLQGLRNRARQDELEIATQRRAAADALDRTRSLLSSAQGALARELDAERRARLAAAGGLALARIHFNGPVRATARTAVQTAASQIGKPYRWGASGPDSYDCSGLTMYSWAAGGVSLPHSSRAQYSSLPHVDLSQLAPGDLVFSGSPIHHVAIYAGDGVVIHAPHTGQTVRRESVWALHPVGAARP